ncbi:MAG: hypothetical protein HQK52_22050 [Oligoflexia bacterium]|nr:hypothetical protein [Oligoflexia bacterium]
MARNLYRELVSQNMELSDELWLHLIEASLKTNDLRESEREKLLAWPQNGKNQLIRLMASKLIKDYNIKKSSTQEKTLAALKAYKENNYQLAKNIYRELFSGNTVLDNEELLKFFESSIKCGDLTEKEKSVLLKLSQDKDSSMLVKARAKKLLELIPKAVNPMLCDKDISIAAHEGRIVDIISLYEQMQALGQRPSEQSTLDYVISLNKSGQFKMALPLLLQLIKYSSNPLIREKALTEQRNIRRHELLDLFKTSKYQDYLQEWGQATVNDPSLQGDLSLRLSEVISYMQLGEREHALKLIDQLKERTWNAEGLKKINEAKLKIVKSIQQTIKQPLLEHFKNGKYQNYLEKLALSLKKDDFVHSDFDLRLAEVVAHLNLGHNESAFSILEHLQTLPWEAKEQQRLTELHAKIITIIQEKAQSEIDFSKKQVFLKQIQQAQQLENQKKHSEAEKIIQYVLSNCTFQDIQDSARLVLTKIHNTMEMEKIQKCTDRLENIISMMNRGSYQQALQEIDKFSQFCPYDKLQQKIYDLQNSIKTRIEIQKKEELNKSYQSYFDKAELQFNQGMYTEAVATLETLRTYVPATEIELVYKVNLLKNKILGVIKLKNRK